MSEAALTPRTEAWLRAGRQHLFGPHRIHVHARPGAADSGAPPILFLHGYPSSSHDWRATLDLLPDHRVVAFDFLGFGLSDKPRDVRYSLHLQADLAEQVAAEFIGEPLILVAHDMGSSVATELLARGLEGRLSFQPVAVLLTNASLVLEKASLTISQKLLRSRLGPLAARLSNERGFRIQFRRLFSAQHPLSDEEAADQWSLLAYNGGQRILDRLIYYLHERLAYASRWHGALREWPGPLHLAWAGRDPICTEAVLEAVLALRPHAPLRRLAELGHYPQLEDPAAVAAAIAEVAAATERNAA